MMDFDCQREVLLFFKYYDPAKRMIFYMGHIIEHIMTKFSKLHLYMYSTCMCIVEREREREREKERERDEEDRDPVCK